MPVLLLTHEPISLRVYFSADDGWVWEIRSGDDIVDASFAFDQKEARMWGEYALAQYSK